MLQVPLPVGSSHLHIVLVVHLVAYVHGECVSLHPRLEAVFIQAFDLGTTSWRQAWWHKRKLLYFRLYTSSLDTSCPNIQSASEFYIISWTGFTLDCGLEVIIARRSLFLREHSTITYLLEHGLSRHGLSLQHPILPD